MEKELKFKVFKGDTQYMAQGMNAAIVTQALTLEELMSNIQEATALHFEGEDPAEIGFVTHPSVLVNFELPLPDLAHV